MREIFLLVTALGVLAGGYVAGAVEPVFVNDSTGIVWGVAGLGVLGTLLARRRRAFLVWLCEKHIPTTFGLLGTFIGAWLMVSSGGEVPDADDVAGAMTAMGTSIAGIITWLWLLLVREWTR